MTRLFDHLKQIQRSVRIQQMKRLAHWVAVLCLLGATAGASAAEYPKPTEADWTARDFRFSSGQVMPALKLHYTTIGNPAGEPVLVLHGTAGSGTGMLSAAFAGELFGPGQPLDATRYFIILPDALGAGKSAKPSDGARASFPHYNYADMVLAQYRLVTEGLGVKHLRLVLGNSMGGMHTWLWGTTYPGFMDVLVPLASQPTEMAGRNWMTRRLLVESIRQDPDYDNGNYRQQPRGLKLANLFFAVGTSGGTLATQQAAPTRAAADKLIDERLAAPSTADANDLLYQWDASRDYDASPQLDRVRARLLAINAADDERNPPELGIMERELRRVPHAELLLIPASTDTRGHATTGGARLWKTRLAELLQTAPRLAP